MLAIVSLPLHLLFGVFAVIIIYYQIKEHLYTDGKRNGLWWVFSLILFPIIVSFGYLSFIVAIWSKLAKIMH